MKERNGSFGAQGQGAQTEYFLMRTILMVWRGMFWILGIGNLCAGTVLTFGPPRYRAAPTYGIFETLNLPELTFPVLLAISGLLILLTLFVRSLWFSIGVHVFTFIAMSWWALVAVGFLLDGSSISGAGAFYVAQLAGIHLCIVIAKLRRRFMMGGEAHE